MLAGKIIMCLVLAYAGHYSYSKIVDIFESSGLMGVAASVVLLVIILYIMIKVDWTKLIDSVTKAAS
jgi:ACR3 family arsenite efflux pump ArsB